MTAPWKAREILAAVACCHGLAVSDLTGPSRRPHVVAARQEAMRRLRAEAWRRFSMPEIGRMLGGRDHTTVLHGLRRHAARFGDLPPLAERLAAITADRARRLAAGAPRGART